MNIKDISQLLLSKIDIVELISNHVQLKKAGREYHACCPFHQEKTPSFTVSPQKQFYYCFGCQAKGDAITFVMQHLNLSFKEAIEHLAEQYQIALPTQSSQKPRIDRGLYKITRDVALHCKQDLHDSPAAEQYLKDRKITPDIIKKYHLGYTGQSYQQYMQQQLRTQPEIMQSIGMCSSNDQAKLRAKFYQRLMFPIQDTTGRIIAFGGRVLDNRQPKYLNSPETILFKKRETLYGLWQYKQSRDNTVYIVEGYMDVVALASHGVPNSIACLGTAFTENHWRMLRRFTHKATFCFDGDNAGKRAAWQTLLRILPAMQPHNQAFFMFMPEGEDPDSLVQKPNGRIQFEKLSKQAISWDNYLERHLQKHHDTNHVNGQASYTKEAKALIQSLTDDDLKQALTRKLIHPSGKKKPLQNTTTTNTHSTTNLARRLINQLANKDQIWKITIPQQHLTYQEPHEQILQLWLQACSENADILGNELIALLKESPLYEIFNTLYDNNNSTYNPINVQHDLYSLSIIQRNNTINELLQQPQESLTKTDKNILQALIKEKKQLQTIQAELALEN